MKWPFGKQHPALTPEQRAVEGLLSEAMQMPIGESMVLEDIAHDGFGGLRVTRHATHTLVFQRTGSQERSRWADTPDQARADIETYLKTGKLAEPERGCGW